MRTPKQIAQGRQYEARHRAERRAPRHDMETYYERHRIAAAKNREKNREAMRVARKFKVSLAVARNLIATGRAGANGET